MIIPLRLLVRELHPMRLPIYIKPDFWFANFTKSFQEVVQYVRYISDFSF